MPDPAVQKTADPENTGAPRVAPWVHTVVFFVIMFGFGLLPAPAPMTPLGMRAVGIFFALVYGWSTLGMIWPSIAGMLALALLGVMPLNQVIANGWGSTVATLVFFMMMIAKTLETSGISRFVAWWLISRKVVIGRPWLLSWFFLVAVMILASLTSSSAMVLLGWAILQEILRETGAEKGEPFAAFMMIGVVISCCFGAVTFPFRTVGAVSFGVMTHISGMVLNDFLYSVWMFVSSSVLMALYVLVGKCVFRIDARKIAALDEGYFAGIDLSLSRAQKAIFVLMLLLIVVMLAPSVMPADWALTKLLRSLGSNGSAALICLLMCAVRVDGAALMEPRSAILEGVSFNVIFLCAAVLPIATVTFTSEEAGISAFLTQALSPLFQGQSAIVLCVIAVLLGMLLSNVISNVTVPAMLYPALYPIATSVGVGPVSLMCIIVLACAPSFLLPSANPLAAMMFGNAEWIRPEDIYKFGGAFLGVAIVFVCATLPIALVIFP